MESQVDQVYRNAFRDRVLASRPKTLLEVGSGSGTFLHSVKGNADRIVGLDPSEDFHAELRGSGFEMHTGTAAALPFSDNEFDCVAMSFTPHHLEEWEPALHEALRVARQSVQIMDGWYEIDFPDQRVARAYEVWSKGIDERMGMVHRPVLSAALLAAPALRMGAQVDYAFKRIVEPADIAALRSNAEDQLMKATGDIGARRTLDTIWADVEQYGITVEGVIQMSILKSTRH